MGVRPKNSKYNKCSKKIITPEEKYMSCLKLTTKARTESINNHAYHKNIYMNYILLLFQIFT